MRHITFIVLGCLSIIALAVAADLAWRHESPRPAAVAQQKQIIEGMSMRIDRLNIMTHLETGHTVLQVYCTFLGGDPNQDYFLHVSVCPPGERPDTNPGNGQQIATGHDTTNSFPRLWECRPPPPESAKTVVVGVLLHPKAQSFSQTERYVEFTVPYHPTHVPRA